MVYSFVGILAIILHLIINIDVFRRKGDKLFPSERYLRLLLLGVILYHLTDAVWGILYEQHLVIPLYADTVVYFAAMGLSVLLWTLYVLKYLGKKSFFTTVLHVIGWAFFAFHIVGLIINFFTPVFFRIDENCEYYPQVLRYAALSAQMLMFLLTSIWTFVVAVKSDGTVRRRHLTICLFGLIMIACIAAQVFYPLLPLYSVGYLIGCCLLHTFVVMDERVEYMRKEEESLRRDAEQRREIEETRRLAYTDALTGAKSKYAFLEAEDRLDGLIAKNSICSFAIAVFDINDLKLVNDTLGHEAGDEHIKTACRLICGAFAHSPVYRIGGDEFAAIIEGEDYENRNSLMEQFESIMSENHERGLVSVSSGMSDFILGTDDLSSLVFHRADGKMYLKKHAMKENCLKTDQ